MLLALSLSQKESPNSNTSYQYFYKKILWLNMQDTIVCDAIQRVMDSSFLNWHRQYTFN